MTILAIILIWSFEEYFRVLVLGSFWFYLTSSSKESVDFFKNIQEILPQIFYFLFLCIQEHIAALKDLLKFVLLLISFRQLLILRTLTATPTHSVHEFFKEKWTNVRSKIRTLPLWYQHKANSSLQRGLFTAPPEKSY